jgi:gamma-glutamyltranspeptidase/glutathione hydrolase
MDAAFAAAVAQGVADPMMCGIGGIGVLTTFLASTGEALCIRFHGVVGSRAKPDIFTDDVVDIRPGETPRVRGNRNSMGYESVIVPGFVRGMAEGLRRHGSGRVSLPDLLAPSISLARDGFNVYPYLVHFWAPDSPVTDIPPAHVRLAATEACGKIYLRDGKTLRAGERLVQQDYARTLDRLAAEGLDSFYEGSIGSAIADDFEKHGGLFTADDLRRYRPLVGEPLWGAFDGLSVMTDGPPGSGVLVLQILKILEGVDLRSLGWNSPRYLDTLAGVMRYVFARRYTDIADPCFYPVDAGALTSNEWAARARADLDRNSGASPGLTSLGHEGTTHVSVADGDGNAVAITHTNRDSSGVVTAGLGFMFNNDMATYDPVPGRRNSIEPGKRPVTGGAPTILLRDREVVMVIGSPAGPRKVTALVQALLNVRLFGMGMAQAVAAERIHCEGDSIFVEPAFPENTADALAGLGHRVERSRYTARLAAILRDPHTGRLEGGTDPRGGAGLAIAE